MEPEIEATPVLNQDMDGLITALASLGGGSVLMNQATGIGTSRNRAKGARPGSPLKLGRKERCDLFASSGIIQRLVSSYPARAVRGWPEFQALRKGRGEWDESPLQDYLDRLEMRDLFCVASIEARLHGDCYILLDVDDGQPVDQPVAIDRIRSVRSAVVLFEHEVFPEENGVTPRFYECSFFRHDTEEVAGAMGLGKYSSQKIHASRILRFAGCKLTGKGLELNQGRNLSAIQPVYDSFSDMWQAFAAGSEMVQTYDFFKYAMKGFASLTKREDHSELLRRFTSLQMGTSIINGLMLDKDLEDADFVSRSYSGLDSVLEKLMEAMVANSDMPWFILIQSMNKGGLGSSGRSDAQRYQWAESVQDWAERYWREPIRQLVRYIGAAADGPEIPQGVKPHFPTTIELSPLEDAERRQAIASTHEANIRAGIYTKYEARMSTHGGSRFSVDVQLDDRITTRLEDESVNPPAPPTGLPLMNKPAGDQEDPEGKGDATDPVETEPREDSTDAVILADQIWEQLGSISAQDFAAAAIQIAQAEGD
jgi:hypothetical protein